MLVLAEEHENMECMVGNSKILSAKLESVKTATEFLIVSEGSGVHTCYSAVFKKAPHVLRDRSIIETPPDKKRDLHRFSQFILLSGIMRPGRIDPSGEKINKAWHELRMRHDGYVELMKKLPDGEELAIKFIETGLSGNLVEHSKILEQILGLLVSTEGIEPNVKELAAACLRGTDSESIDKQIIAIRDRELIQRVEARVRLEPSVKLVVYITGLHHYDSICSLIRSSDILQLDPASSRKAVNSTMTKATADSLRGRALDSGAAGSSRKLRRERSRRANRKRNTRRRRN
jgi:hypothetical protein